MADKDAAPKPIDFTGMKLKQKIVAIRKAIHNVEKRGTNKHFEYDYVTASDVAGIFGTRLAEAGIIIGRRNLEAVRSIEGTDEKPMVNVSLKCEYGLLDADSGEELWYACYGEGSDRTDKGAYKAWTGMFKYFLLQAFALATGDDPEAEEEDDKQEERKPVDNHNARITENKFIDNGRGDREVLATAEQRKELLAKAKGIMGAKEGTAWVLQRMEDLGIKGPNDFQLHNCTMLTNELDELESRTTGERVEPIEEQSDIEW